MIGQTLAHYRITAALGAGGMVEVYRASDTNLNRDVAIRCCSWSDRPDAIARSASEGQGAGALEE